MRTVEWDFDNAQLRLIDQRLLPGEFRINAYSDYRDVVHAIRSMVVRGAPAIGVTAAFALALAGNQSTAQTIQAFNTDLKSAAKEIAEARPTAVNLQWAINHILSCIDNSELKKVDELKSIVLAEAQRLADEDVAINLRMARHGSELISDGDTIIHHCNTGSLAAVDWGTALGVVRMAHEQGKRLHVLVDETRPRLQGARLTAWELMQYGIPFDIISDNAAGYFLSRHEVQKVFFGADRVAANGDVANKIGTYMLSLAAFDNAVPAYAVVPTSTVDLTLASGSQIPIEERGMNEVLDIDIGGVKVVPEGSTARNPAFDITPNRLVSAIVTENGIVYPPYKSNLRRAVISG
jgi:methylthioribose-1-phosphate isomerase